MKTLDCTISLVAVLFSFTTATMYRYQHHPPYYSHPGSERYVAVPGRIISQFPFNPLTIPQTFPIIYPYELETESSSSPPEEDEEDEDFQSMNPPPPPAEEAGPPPSMKPPPPPSPPPSNNNHHHHHMKWKQNQEMKPSHSGVIHKYVSVHVPPKELDSGEYEDIKVIRPPSPYPKKHVNIVFIKAPSPPSHKNTEIVLPENPQQKTIVYVLVKRPDPMEGIRLRRPSPTEPPKPQVYFIRYEQNKKEDS